MAWGDLNNDDLVSFTNMQSSGIPLKSGQSATTSNDIMTKDAVTTKYFLDLSVSTLAAKNSLDCVAKKDLSTGTAYSYLVRVSTDYTFICGELEITVYSPDSSYAISMTLYTDSTLTNLLTGYSWIVGPDSTIRDLNPSTGVIGPNTVGVC